jgi:uncharacterized RmlC-like cupin family protein
MNTCKLVRGAECIIGKPGLNYFSRISAELAEALAICMPMLDLPPGASAKPHCYASHKAAMYMAKGGSELPHGPNLEFKEHKGVVLI